MIDNYKMKKKWSEPQVLMHTHTYSLLASKRQTQYIQQIKDLTVSYLLVMLN